MRIRRMTFMDYGLSDERVAEMLAYCKQPGNIESVRYAATCANVSIADAIVSGLTTGKGYERLIYWYDICYTKADFYAYRRLTVALLHVLLTEGDPGFWEAEVLEGWLRSKGKYRRGNQRRPATRSRAT